jgi:hypothetical protein
MADSMVFRLKDSVDDLASANEGMSRYSYDQIQVASGTGTGPGFANGQLRFKWEHASNKWWFPSKSYLEMRMRVVAADGTTPLALAGLIGPNMNICGSLFQQAEFQIGGKTVSKIGEYLPQVDTLKKRLTKSKAWLDGIGSSTMFMQPSGEVRKAEVTSDGVVAGQLGGAGVASRRVKSFGTMWQPPLSIFDVDVLPGGMYELILTPEASNNFKKFAVEQTGAASVQKIAGTDYDVIIDEIFFYVCSADADRLDDKEYYIDLQSTKCSIGAQTLKAGGTSQQQFDVSPSTSALTVAFQDARAGFDTRISRTKLLSYLNADGATGTQLDNTATADFGRGDLLLNRLFINYAGQSQPVPEASPEFNTNVDRTIRRYVESQLNSGMYWNEGSPESIRDFHARGPYYHFNTPKDPTDKSTRVSVYSGFAAHAPVNDSGLQNTNLLLFEHYKQVARIVLSQGRVVDVRLEDA